MRLSKYAGDRWAWSQDFPLATLHNKLKNKLLSNSKSSDERPLVADCGRCLSKSYLKSEYPFRRLIC